MSQSCINLFAEKAREPKRGLKEKYRGEIP